jgi:hypothetical protein
MWKHGLRSAEAIERRREMTTAMRMIYERWREDHGAAFDLVLRTLNT